MTIIKQEGDMYRVTMTQEELNCLNTACTGIECLQSGFEISTTERERVIINSMSLEFDKFDTNLKEEDNHE